MGTTADYDYDYDYLEETCNTSTIIETGVILTSVSFCIVAIFSVLGNVLVLAVLVKYENLRSIINHFIMNLAVSDLLFTAGLPFWVHYHIHGWTFGETACKTINFIFYVGFYSSSTILILMTVHRYVAVMYPLSSVMSITGFCSIVATVIIWVVSAGLASPAFIFSRVENSYCGYLEQEQKLWEIYQQNAFFILSIVVLIFCYSQILCRLLRPTVKKRKNKTLKLIFILVVVFFVGWGPYNIIIFLKSMSLWNTTAIYAGDCNYYKRLDSAFYISRLFAFSHCCINPVLYVFAGIKFKSHLKKILKCASQNTSSISNRQNRLTITSLASGDDFSHEMN